MSKPKTLIYNLKNYRYISIIPASVTTNIIEELSEDLRIKLIEIFKIENEQVSLGDILNALEEDKIHLFIHFDDAGWPFESIKSDKEKIKLFEKTYKSFVGLLNRGHSLFISTTKDCTFDSTTGNFVKIPIDFIGPSSLKEIFYNSYHVIYKNHKFYAYYKDKSIGETEKQDGVVINLADFFGITELLQKPFETNWNSIFKDQFRDEQDKFPIKSFATKYIGNPRRLIRLLRNIKTRFEKFAEKSKNICTAEQLRNNFRVFCNDYAGPSDSTTF